MCLDSFYCVRSVKSFIVDKLELNFEQISEKHISWLRGFVYCNNNSALFKIKVIIAKHTNNQELIEKLSNETNEKKIIFALLTNFNKNEKNEYVINNTILRKIFINSIDNFDCKIAIAILKRKELEYSLFYDIFKHCKDEISLTRLQNNEYFDTKITKYIEEQLISIDKKQKNIYEETKVDIDPPKITLDYYQSIEDDEKMRFLESADFNLIDTNFIEFIVNNEGNIDRLEDFTDNKTLPLKYLLLTYNHNINRATDDVSRLKENIKRRNQKLYEMIELNIFGLTNYIDKNFNTIDREILLGYAITAGKKFYYIREKISELTNDLDVLNELSKHQDDKKVLKNIVLKNNKNNKNFVDLVKSKNTIFSLEILDRIARYTDCYEFVITHLASNYSLTDETKEYLFEKYKNDKVFLEVLSKNKSSWELQNKIESALHDSYNECSNNNEIFNGISFN